MFINKLSNMIFLKLYASKLGKIKLYILFLAKFKLYMGCTFVEKYKNLTTKKQL